jgi:GTP cyclohydrolase II
MLNHCVGRAYNLQDMGYDTVAANLLLQHPPDARQYDVGAAILRDLGIDRCRLLTNNPDKMEQLEHHGIHVQERISIVHSAILSNSNTANGDEGGIVVQEEVEMQGRIAGSAPKEMLMYLRTKVERMRHIMDIRHTDDGHID